MSQKFDALKKSYPNQERKAFFDQLGGQWPDLVEDTKNYGNTCAVRLSVALRKAGYVIGPQYKEAIDGDGNPLVLKVKTMDRLITELLGQWTWGMSKNPGDDITDDLPSYKGIIVYHADWKDATGHFDLWDKDRFVGFGSINDIKDGYDIAIWRL